MENGGECVLVVRLPLSKRLALGHTRGMEWFVVRTEPGQERAAALALGGYCPVVTLPVRRRGRLVDIARAMLPGYAFAAAGDETLAALHRPNVGVGRLQLLGAGGQPQRIRQWVVDQVKRVETELSELPRWERSKLQFSIGQGVQLVDGSALAGLMATVVEAKNELVRVKLQMLGAERYVSVPSEKLVLISASVG